MELRAATLQLAEQLIRFESTADPPNQITACLESIENYLRGSGLVLRRHERAGSPSLVVTFAETMRPAVFLNGHIDVVPGNRDQFEPRVENGRLYGRGAIDMKAAVAAMAVLMKHWAAHERRPDVGLMIVGDEEIGGQNGTAYLIELGYDCAFFLAGEPTALKIGNRAKGVARLELIARGRPAHAARPWEGESAVEVMMRAYPAIRAAFPLPETHTPEATASLTVISGGDAVNRLPAECRLSADIRYPETESLHATFAELEAALPRVELGHSVLAAPVNTSAADPYVACLSRAIETVTGQPAELMSKDAASDARFFAARGAPAVVFGPTGGGGHGDEEWVDLPSLFMFQAALDQFVRTVGRASAV